MVFGVMMIDEMSYDVGNVGDAPLSWSSWVLWRSVFRMVHVDST